MSALRPWASMLGFLDSEPAAAVEQMARRIHLFLGVEARPAAGEGDPDGFGGIARHGDLERLLLSEWLVADEEPLEFLRRYTTGELAYLRREHRSPRSAERLVVLADTGADQAGAPRLVHLAALVVLFGRAEARGVPLALGLLSEPPGAFLEGDLPRLFEAWLAARVASRPTVAQVRAWLQLAGPDDDGWILGAEAALGELGPDRPQRLRRLTVREGAWSARGATRADVWADGRTLHLPLPPAPVGVRLLRGEGIRRSAGVPVGRVSTILRFPRFAGSGRRLLCRTSRPDELLVIPVVQPGHDRAPAPQPRRLQFPGPVVAAGLAGKRTVALVRVGDRLRVSVVGKPLAELAGLEVDAGPVGKAVLDEAVERDLAPLLLHGDALLVRLQGRWLTISRSDVGWDRMTWGGAAWGAIHVAVPSTRLDQPVVITRREGLVFVRSNLTMPEDHLVVLGPQGLVAFGPRGGPYTVLNAAGTRWTIRTEADETLLGVVSSGQGSLLIVRSGGDRILRLRGASQAKTLTAASGDLVDVTIHPTLPLLAVQRSGGAIEAFSLPDGRPVAILLGSVG